jgi:hypothetical protein
MGLSVQFQGLNTFTVIIFGFVVAFFIFLFSWNWYRRYDRKRLIRHFKAAPSLRLGDPALIRGVATGPVHRLPSSGEPVAFYSIDISSRVSEITSARRIQVGPIGIGSRSVTGFHALRIFDQSGDFTVVSGGTEYLVNISSIFSYFQRGETAFSKFLSTTGVFSGAPPDAITMTMDGAATSAVLQFLLGYSASVATETLSHSSWGTERNIRVQTVNAVTSTVNATFQDYTSETVPPGVKAILDRKGATLSGDDEITVTELYIPIGKEVYVFGTYDGENRISYRHNIPGLSVSYQDPEFI